ncbi:MAG: VOC family protein [Moraxella sp.]|nr:VOC family protein [Moraxella sp.]
MSHFIPKADIRHAFSLAMSKMYQTEVPLYKDLMDLVADINADTLAKDSELKQHLSNTGELSRIDLERHGAIRLGLPSELATMRRLFAVMGMYPVGYYDLAPAGVPVHSTAFRAIDSSELQISPFRVFCSLLRPELIDDDALRDTALQTLQNRQIFSDGVLALIDKCEQDGGLNADDADKFVSEAIKTFQWHKTSPISKAFYEQLLSQHRLIADVVGFYGPHINHLTPRTLDIDEVQDEMGRRGITAKEIIEGPPRRNCPILLRQTSFKALNEAIIFTGDGQEAGSHTARFGEIEQRGIALTPKGRALYDELLAKARANLATTPEKDPDAYYQALSESFTAFPDNYQSLYDEGLAYFYYQLSDDFTSKDMGDKSVQTLLNNGVLRLEPIVYEDFLPVSAAGIFQSNLGDDAKSGYDGASNQAAFEHDLGATVYDECTLYQAMMDKSLAECLEKLSK